MSRFDRDHDHDNPTPLADLLALSHCVRWSIVPVLRSQSVADHTFRVIVIASELTVRIGLGEAFIGPVMHWAMMHDGDESRTGDIQSSFKRILHEEAEAEVLSPDTEQTCLDRAWKRAAPWHYNITKLVREHTFGKLIMSIVKLADRIEMTTFLTQWGHGPQAEHVQGRLAHSVHVESNRLADALIECLDDIATIDKEAATRISTSGTRYAAIKTIVDQLMDEIVTEHGRRTDPK
jgi:5'-deoxynucleotidase YfbR-like HD superfamily hydrolase